MVPLLVPLVRTLKLKLLTWELSVMILEFKSFKTSVKVLVPPEMIDADPRVKVDWLKETAPTFTVTVGAEPVIVAPFAVAVMVVADPEVTPIKLAV